MAGSDFQINWGMTVDNVFSMLNQTYEACVKIKAVIKRSATGTAANSVMLSPGTSCPTCPAWPPAAGTGTQFHAILPDSSPMRRPTPSHQWHL
jgi:hypothetical protein